MVKRFNLLFIVVFSMHVHVFAQTGQQLFEKMLHAFQSLKYENAQQYALQITENYESHTLFELVEAHKILGIIAYQRDQKINDATSQFEGALSLDQTTVLDSIYVSPKTIQFFEALKSKFLTENKTGESARQVSYRYMIQPDPRPSAALRSLLVPGWGQLHKNDRRKGYVLISSAAIATATVGIFHILQHNAHTDYKNATEPGSIEQKYDSYNRLYKIRNNSALLLGGVWLYAFFDALLVPPKPGKRDISISFKIDDYPSLVAQFTF